MSAPDFFGYQRAARRKSVVLFFAFALCLSGVVLILFVLIQAMAEGRGVSRFRWGEILPILVGVGVVVGLGAWIRNSALSSGGAAVAKMLGGRRIHPDSRKPEERRVLNVVEEMAIASGLPVPQVFVLKEQSINAFAAGRTPGDAVVGVTEGSLTHFTRDELQGVVAHEFSHILNGDMRINIRLTALVFGIACIAHVGSTVLRSMPRVRVRNDDSGKAQIAILGVGLALMIVGGLGALFGTLLKAAVSRQREYLADASAVDFTRNPDGIGNALKKIGGISTHGRLRHPRAREFSHMYFSQGVGAWLLGLNATHPPLDKRILRIDPGFNGRYPEVVAREEAAPEAEPAATEQKRQGPAPLPIPSVLPGAAALAGAAPVQDERRARRRPRKDRVETALESIGDVSAAHVERSRELLAGLPPALKDAAHEAYSARAVVFVLLLDAGPEMQKVQWERLEQGADADVVEETRRLHGETKTLQADARLALLDLTMPALREMSRAQYRTFRKNVEGLIQADDKVDLFEWVLRRILLRHLGEHFEHTRRTPVRYQSFQKVANACAVLLGTFARVGHETDDNVQNAYEAGVKALGIVAKVPPAAFLDLRRLDATLINLRALAPRLKRKLLSACAAVLAHDHKVTVEEAELFRAIADTLGAPVPPILPGQKLA